jgi:hypothetical protein
MFTLFGATELSSEDFDASYDDYTGSINNPPPPIPCSVPPEELDWLEEDLVNANVDFLHWVFDGAEGQPECAGNVEACSLTALLVVAPGFVPPSQGGQEGPYNFMPDQVGAFMDEFMTCLTKDTNEGIPPGAERSGEFFKTSDFGG